MATTMTTILPAHCMSSQLPDIEFSTSAAKLIVALYDTTNNTRFLQVTLTAVSGMVTLTEVREAVEQRMADSDQRRLALQVQWRENDTDSWSSTPVRVHYCDLNFDGDADTWMLTHFLTTQSWKPMPLDGRTEMLHLYHPTAGEQVTFAMQAMCRLADGTVTPITLSQSSSIVATDDVIGYTWTLQDVETQVEQQIEEAADILAISVMAGQRTMNYYRTLQPDLVLRFRNCFNVDEWAAINCATRRKVKDDRDTAMVGRRAVRYGRGRAVEYETETAPLMMAHALWLDQALTSPKTWLADGTPIVITDSDISVTDDRAALNTVKFTWRRADGRAHIVVEQSDRIFTEEFTRQFN